MVGTVSRLAAHFLTPAEWAGLDTLVPPLLSLITFVLVCQLTWREQDNRHYVLAEAVQEGA